MLHNTYKKHTLAPSQPQTELHVAASSTSSGRLRNGDYSVSGCEVVYILLGNAGPLRVVQGAWSLVLPLEPSRGDLMPHHLQVIGILPQIIEAIVPGG